MDLHVDSPCLSVSALSFNAGHLSYVAELSTERKCVVVDGKFGRHYDEVYAPTFSPDGAHFIYEASRDDKTYLLLDDEEMGPFAFLPWEPTWSADSQHLAYSVADDDGMHVVLDNQPGQSYSCVSEIQFHPVTNELAYLAESPETGFVVLGEDAFEITKEIFSNLHCNPHIRDFAVQVYINDGVRVHTLAEASGPACEMITTLIFSPDGKQFAYTAEMNDCQCLLLNHDVVGSYDIISQSSLTFTPDISQLLYVASTAEHDLLIKLHPFQSTAYERINCESLRFSSDGTHFAFVASIDNCWHLILDGKPSAPHDEIGTPVFSPDSKHLAYRLRDGKEWRMIIDDRPASRPLVAVSDPLFITDSEVTYLAGEGNQFRFVEVVRYQ